MNKQREKKNNKKLIGLVIGIMVVCMLVGGAIVFYLYAPNTPEWFCKHIISDATCLNASTCSRCHKVFSPELGHDWTEATCTSPKACVRCEQVDGDALGHLWLEATCERAYYCERCDDEQGEPLGHEWIEATCLEVKHCEVCKKTEGQLADHKWKNATCFEPKTCIICNVTEGDKLEHKWQDATCTTGTKCSGCGKEKNDKLGHTCAIGVCSRCKQKVGQDVLKRLLGYSLDIANDMQSAISYATTDVFGFSWGLYMSMAVNSVEHSCESLDRIIACCGDYSELNDLKQKAEYAKSISPEGKVGISSSTGELVQYSNSLTAYSSATTVVVETILKMSNT